MYKDNLEKWNEYLKEQPKYINEIHELHTKMVKEILLTIQKKEIDLYTLSNRLNISLKELMEYLEFKKESFAMYSWILKTIKKWDKEE